MLPSNSEPHFPEVQPAGIEFEVNFPMPTPKPSAPMTWLKVVGVAEVRRRVPLSWRPPIMVGLDESWMSVAMLYARCVTRPRPSLPSKMGVPLWLSLDGVAVNTSEDRKIPPSVPP